MGNLCRKTEQEPDIIGFSKKQQSQRRKMSLNQQIFYQARQKQRINQIKDFLSLTSQNTDNCYHLIKDQKIFVKAQKAQISDFIPIRALGKGFFGEVLMVKQKQSDQYYAMKIISKQNILTEQQKINALSQRYILESMDHPFIVKLHYAFQSQRKLYLLVDLMTGGQLFYLLRKNKKFQEDVARFYAAELILALQYLHDKNIIYRDLKPENVLLDLKGHIKITDFGLSKVCFSANQLTYSFCGTPQYIAPEVVKGKGYNITSDWFSFGSLLYDMLTGKPPFYSQNKSEMLRKITNLPIPMPDYLSKNAVDLLNRLFDKNPKSRLGCKSADEIKNHVFFSSLNFQKLMKKQLKTPISFEDSKINNGGFQDNLSLKLASQTLFHNLETHQFHNKFDGFTYQRVSLAQPILSTHLKYSKEFNKLPQNQFQQIQLQIQIQEQKKNSQIQQEKQQLYQKQQSLLFRSQKFQLNKQNQYQHQKNQDLIQQNHQLVQKEIELQQKLKQNSPKQK